LAQRAVRAMVVKVRHILGQHRREVAAVDDPYPYALAGDRRSGNAL
jgi:hypothetical protein